MTFYALGKTIDNCVVYVSDGQIRDDAARREQGGLATKVVPVYNPDPNRSSTAIGMSFIRQSLFPGSVIDKGITSYPNQTHPNMILAVSGSSYYGFALRSVINDSWHSASTESGFFNSNTHSILRDRNGLSQIYGAMMKNMPPEAVRSTCVLDVVSSDCCGFKSTKLVFTENGPLLLGYDDEFEFPFISGGRAASANDIFLQLYLWDRHRLNTSNMETLLLGQVAVSENNEPSVGGEYYVGALYRDRHVLACVGTQYKRWQDYVLAANQLCNLSVYPPPDRLNSHLTKKKIQSAIYSLDDFDVLRRMAHTMLDRVPRCPGNEAGLNENAIFFYRMYLDLIESEARPHRLEINPVMVEPIGGNPAFYLAVLQDNNVMSNPSVHYGRFRSRSAISFGDILNRSGIPPENSRSLFIGAAGDLERIVSKTKDAQDLSWLGKAYLNLGKTNEARAVFNGALAGYVNRELTKPDLMAAIRSLKGLEQLGKDVISERIRISQQAIESYKLTEAEIELI